MSYSNWLLILLIVLLSERMMTPLLSNVRSLIIENTCSDILRYVRVYYIVNLQCTIVFVFMCVYFLKDYIIQHSRQYVIELDANLPPIQLFRVSTM